MKFGSSMKHSQRMQHLIIGINEILKNEDCYGSFEMQRALVAELNPERFNEYVRMKVELASRKTVDNVGT